MGSDQFRIPDSKFQILNSGFKTRVLFHAIRRAVVITHNPDRETGNPNVIINNPNIISRDPMYGIRDLKVIFNNPVRKTHDPKVKTCNPNRETEGGNHKTCSCKKDSLSCSPETTSGYRTTQGEVLKKTGIEYVFSVRPFTFHFLLFAFCFSLLNCSSSGNKDSSPKFTQYYNQGETLYEKNCSNCHQRNGTGLGRVYPPLATSDYMKSNLKEVICLIRHGKKGELTVNGKIFNQAMPGIPSLTDLEIAEIATYIYNTWDHQQGIIEVKEVSSILENCSGEK